MSRQQNSDQAETGHHSEYRTDETPVEAVVTAVADVTDQSPVEMQPLGEVVDNDALTALLAAQDDRSSPATVTFDYCDQRVTLTPDRVEIGSANASD